MKLRIGSWVLVFFSLALSMAAQVTGSGKTNYIPIWTGTATLGDSVIFQTGGQVGIGTTTPNATLTVKGPAGTLASGNPPTALSVTGGHGGGKLAGNGGGILLTSGSGGGGGAGGQIALTTGTGGGGGFEGGGGPGGEMTLTTGRGIGSGGGGEMMLTTGAGGGSETSGGAMVLTTGPGGTDCGVGVLGCPGGNGGSVAIQAGGGANASSGFNLSGGTGGSITLQPGAAGTGNPAGLPGNVILNLPEGGAVGVGTTSPTAALDVAAGLTTLADAWTTRSSRQFKTNIQPLDGALEKVVQLQGVSYERKSDGKHEIGVVAEDVEQIVPEIVSRDRNTHAPQGVDYSRLTALLIEAVKQQQVEIQNLKAEIERLASNPGGQ